LRFLVRAHFHEREPAWSSGRLVAHHGDRLNGSSAREKLLELCFSSFVGEISDVQLSTHELTPSVAERDNHISRRSQTDPQVDFVSS
jgi:hypothetical protein